jgi:branched-chain amino acid transport system substrate-binding protein
VFLYLIFVFLFPALGLCEASFKVGAVYPLSGPVAHIGESNKRGAEVAVALINEAGGVNGMPLELVLEDSQSEPRFGVSAFQKISQDDDVAVILVTLTSVAMSVREMAEREKVVMIAESTHPELVNNYGYTFRHFFTSESGVRAVLELIKKKKYQSAAILHAEEEWGETAAKKFVEASSTEGFSVVAKESFLRSETNLKPQLLRIAQKNPEMLFIIGLGAPVATAYRQRVELGIAVPSVGYVVCGQDTVMDAAKPYLDNTFSLDPYMNEAGEAYKKLLAKHKELFPNYKINQSTVTAFDTINIVAAAYKTGATTSEEIKTYLLKAAGLEGIMGTIEFSPEGDSVVPMVTSKINNGLCERM